MADEDKKKDSGTTEQKKPSDVRPAPPPRKPDFDEGRLRAEVTSVPLQRLREKFPEQIEEVLYYAGEVIVRVRQEKFPDICSFLKEDSATGMNFLSSITGIDYPDREKRFDLVYHLYSISRNHRLTIKVSVGENESIPSVTGIWKTANWHEREAYDLLGINFSGHPNLERILTPDNFEGHPLRKDFPVEGRPQNHVKFR